MSISIKLVLFLVTALTLSACSAASPTQPADMPVPIDEIVPETGPAAAEGPAPASTGNAELAGFTCTSPAALTPSAMEGPFYTAGSPERTALVEDLPGTRLVLTGYVLDTDCEPVPGAWIDFWQADSQGVYDNTGYTLRGHQYADDAGRFVLETIVPGNYPGRTEHLHVKVQAPGGPALTTQLYFPDASQNRSDRLFDQDLLLQITSEGPDEIQAVYIFVVNR
jgi:protocatechuate 3,4-dioxygenase beta subunit